MGSCSNADLHLRNLTTFVVTTEDGNTIPKPNLQRHQERDGLQGIVPPINIIPHEEVVGLGARPPDPEQLRQVIELAVDVAAYGYGGAHGLNVGFLLQNFFCLKNSNGDMPETCGERKREGGTEPDATKQTLTAKCRRTIVTHPIQIELTLSHRTLTSFSDNVPPPLSLSICSSSWSTSGLGIVACY